MQLILTGLMVLLEVMEWNG